MSSLVASAALTYKLAVHLKAINHGPGAALVRPVLTACGQFTSPSGQTTVVLPEKANKIIEWYYNLSSGEITDMEARGSELPPILLESTAVADTGVLDTHTWRGRLHMSRHDGMIIGVDCRVDGVLLAEQERRFPPAPDPAAS